MNSAAWAMTEDRGPDSLESRVRKLMTDLKLWGYHPRNSIGSAKGWPDWVILGPGGALFRELKSEQGQLTPDQRDIGAMLTRTGLDWAVWRPSDLLHGIVREQLAAISAYKPCVNCTCPNFPHYYERIYS
jgi:hypothetical protein